MTSLLRLQLGMENRARVCRLLVLLGVLATSCSGAEAEPDWPDQELAQSVHFRYFVRPTDSFQCAEVATVLEEHWGRVQEYFGRMLDIEPVDYYKFESTEDIIANGPCRQRPGSVIQCQRGSQLFAHEAFQAHELIHAYTAGMGRSARFLDEGLADALTCGVTERAASGSSLDELVGWSNGQDSAVALQSDASVLVAHLLEERGPDVFFQLFERLRPGATLEEVQAAFQGVYGMEPATLYESSQEAAGELGCVRGVQCAGASWDITRRSYEVGGGCGLGSSTPFQVLEPSLFVGFVAHLGACTRDLSVPAPPQSKPDVIGTTLEAGRYFLGMPATFSEFEESFAAPALLHPLAAVVGDASTCSQLQEIEASLDGVTLSFDANTLARGLEGPLFLRWRDEVTIARADALARQGLQSKVSASCSENVELWLCDGCSVSLSDCAQLCALPGVRSEPTSASPDFPNQPVLGLILDSSAADRIARISIDVFEEPTP